jgi:hypothetical protein
MLTNRPCPFWPVKVIGVLPCVRWEQKVSIRYYVHVSHRHDILSTQKVWTKTMLRLTMVMSN